MGFQIWVQSSEQGPARNQSAGPENGRVDMVWVGESGMNREIRTDRPALPCIK